MSETVSQKITEYYDLREALETHAVARLASSLPSSEIGRMDAVTNEMVSLTHEAKQLGWTPDLADRWLLADAAFHLLLLRAAGNRCLLQFVNEVEIVTGIFGTRQQIVLETDHERVYSEHREIIGSIVRQDIPHSRCLITAHLNNGLQAILGAIDAQCDALQKDRLAFAAAESDFTRQLIALELQLMDGAKKLKQQVRFDGGEAGIENEIGN